MHGLVRAIASHEQAPDASTPSTPALRDERSIDVLNRDDTAAKRGVRTVLVRERREALLEPATVARLELSENRIANPFDRDIIGRKLAHVGGRVFARRDSRPRCSAHVHADADADAARMRLQGRCPPACRRARARLRSPRPGSAAAENSLSPAPSQRDAGEHTTSLGHFSFTRSAAPSRDTDAIALLTATPATRLSVGS